MLAGYLFGLQDRVCTVDISSIKQSIGVDLCLQIINGTGGHGVGQQRSRVIRRKRSLHIVVAVHKIQDKSVFIIRPADAVQTGKRLDRIHALDVF